MRILNHEETTDTGIRLSLCAWSGISCKPGEVKLVLKVEVPNNNSLIGDIYNYSSIHKWDGTRPALRKAIIDFCGQAPGIDADEVPIKHAMIYLMMLFN